MNEATVTVIGWVATDVTYFPGDHRSARAHFRLASTPRWFSAKEERWVAGETLFVTVNCRNALADNVAGCVHKGQPVVVTGRLRLDRWRNEARSGEDLVVDARTVGHDLTRGTSDFVRTRRRDSVGDPPWIRGGVPTDAPPADAPVVGADQSEPRAMPTRAEGGDQGPWSINPIESVDAEKRVA